MMGKNEFKRLVIVIKSKIKESKISYENKKYAIVEENEAVLKEL